MNCQDCQFQIFDGELTQDAGMHLAECEECRSLHHEAQQNAEALASMREATIPVRRARRWPWVAAVAAVLAAAAGLSFRGEPVAPPVEPAKVAAIHSQPAAPVLPLAVRHARKAPVRRVAPVKPPAPVGEPMLVKFLTDDPDVVIYWLIDPVQGEQAL